MKSSIITISFCFIFSFVFGQDSLKIETVQDTFSTPQYEVNYGQEKSEKTNGLWKINLYGLANNLAGKGNGKFEVSYEKRLSEKWTLGIGLGYESYSTLKNTVSRDLFSDPLNFYKNTFGSFSLNLESRSYFNKKIDKNDDKSTLSGLYMGYLLSYAVKENTLIGGSNFGYQKRFLNNLYFDYSVGIYVGGGQKNLAALGVNSEIKVGYAFGKGKKAQAEKCDVFRCFEEEKSLLKIDISSLVTESKFSGFGVVSAFGLKADYERKINNSAWSINGSANILYSTNGQFVKFSTYGFAIEPRFYYNQKNDIIRGKTANNLSGNYFSLEYGYEESNSFIKFSEDYKFQFNSTAHTVTPKWGIQKRIFKHGFFDLSIAPFQYVFINEKDNSVIDDNTLKFNFTPKQSGLTLRKVEGVPVPYVDLKIGFAF